MTGGYDHIIECKFFSSTLKDTIMIIKDWLRVTWDKIGFMGGWQQNSHKFLEWPFNYSFTGQIPKTFTLVMRNVF